MGSNRYIQILKYSVILFFPVLGKTLNSQDHTSNVVSSTKTETVQVIGKVSNSGPQNFRSNPSGFQTAIQLDETSARYTSLPEVLEREAGLRVRSFGGLGSYSTLSIRGTNPNQSRIYLDGIPLNNSQGGEVNLADLPFDSLESVEVYRSGNPIGFSGSAIGGSVNLVTKKDSQKPKTRINLGGGSFNTGKASVSHTGNYKGIGTSFLVLSEKSDQNFSYKNDHGTVVLNTLDDTIDRRKNAAFERAALFGSLKYQIGKTELKFLNDFNHRIHGLPGPGSNQTDRVHRKYDRNTSSFATDTKGLFVDSFRLETRSFYTAAKDDLYDPLSEFSKGTPNSRAEIRQAGFQIIPTLYLTDYHQILRGFMSLEKESFDRERLTSSNVVGRVEPKKERTYSSFRLEDEIRFWNSKILLIPSVTWDHYKDRFPSEEPWYRRQDPLASDLKKTTFTNPKLGFVWKVFEKESWDVQFQANVSRQYRIPSFLEMFGEQGSIVANPNLKPEQSENGDAGFIYKTNHSFLKTKTSVSCFKKDIRDMILFLPNSQFTLRPENVDFAKIRGLEFSHRGDWKYGIKFLFNYTYQEAINTSSSPYLHGKTLPLRPRHEFSSTFSWKGKKLETGIELLYIGAVFRDRTNEYINYIPERQIWNYFFTWVLDSESKDSDLNGNSKEITREVLLTFEVKNFTDKRISDLIGYPLPGRSWYTTLSMRF
ncbi:MULTISPECIES: TonB-dependent receptor plug domain-containing protein [Leptospira]|uniref:TonB-dependent receptor plug domain-containing protein n=1 Tax=Leptospira TaxID=171 RepID=UPI0002BED8EC|nr:MULTISPECIES: TonB-dependent receptor [Leptospira]EMK04226.1 TonB-dependent receptor [Leptospira kirschneri]KXZ21350.1 TonB-dependent receptor [Leptospira kirschneri]KXZ25774.1 TonB-dependent receptor [Leptospira sp. ZV016]